MAAVANATNAAIEADVTLRRRLGDANATALIADVVEQARQGPMRPSYDQLLSYVQEKYGIGGQPPGAGPSLTTLQRTTSPAQSVPSAVPGGPAPSLSGSTRTDRSAVPNRLEAARQAPPAGPRLPQAIARAVSGADEVLTPQWAELSSQGSSDADA
jgi:hypothetical protein